MKKTLLFIFAICAILANLSAQEKYYTVPFEKILDKDYSRVWRYIAKEKNVDHLKNLPENSIYAVYSMTVNSDLPAPKDSIDYNYYKGNKIYFYTAIDKEKNEKYVIVDKNNNYDFSDDEMYTFSLEGAPDFQGRREKIQVNVNATYYIKNNSIPTILNIQIEPLEKSMSTRGGDITEDDKLLDIAVWDLSYFSGQCSVNEIALDFRSDSRSMILSDINNNFTFSVAALNDPTFIYQSSLKIGDSLEVAGKILKLEKVYKNTLFLKDMGAASVYGGMVGKQFPEELLVKNIKSKKEFNLRKEIEGKYVFIDFWGSWCGPCIQSVPKLVEMYAKIGKRKDVAVIGLAAEEERDLEKLSGLIKDKKIKWANYWFLRKEYLKADNPCQKMTVVAYPTYIILDKSGKVVYRESSSFKAEEACQFFLNLIEKK